MKAGVSSIVSSSTSDWEPLIAALRAELQEFGGLIRLLNDEQDTISSNPASVLGTPESITRQHALALMSSRIRHGLMVVPGPHGELRVGSAAEIIANAPDGIRPLLGALFSEVEKLAMRAGDRASQNDWLRKRAPMLAAAIAERATSDAR